MPSTSFSLGRRSFLKTAGSLGALPVSLIAQDADATMPGSTKPGPIKGWLTHGTQRFQPFTAQWQTAGSTVAPGIRIEPTLSKQELLGSGRPLPTPLASYSASLRPTLALAC